MRDPALVLGAVLMRPVDAAHAQHGSRETVAAGVIEHVLVGGAFRTAIRAVKLQRPGLGDAGAGERACRHVAGVAFDEIDVVDRAINLVCRGEDQPRRAAPSPQRFEQFERGGGVDREIVGRIVETGGHGDLRGEMKHRAGFRDGVAQPRGRAHIRDLDPHREPCVARSQRRLRSEPGRARLS